MVKRTRNPGAASWALPVGAALHGETSRRVIDDNVVVGVIDTGVVIIDDKPHPWIAPNLDKASRGKPNWDTLPKEGQPLGLNDGHGTCVAGLVAWQAPNARIHVRRALDTDDEFNDELVAEQIRALTATAELKVLNLSFYGDQITQPSVIGEALTRLFRANEHVIVVAAAGNQWSAEPHWAAALDLPYPDHLVTVGAVDETVVPVEGLQPPKASFSNCPPGLTVYAPGVQILGPAVVAEQPQIPVFRPPLLPHERDALGDLIDGSYQPPGWTFGWAKWSGTSFAAATVTGILAQALLAGKSAREALDAIKSGPRFAPVPGGDPTTPLVHVMDGGDWD